MSLRTTFLHPLTRTHLLHVIANQCMGPRKGTPFVGRGAPRERCPALAVGRHNHGAPQSGTLCGERRPKGALPCSGLWPELGMADFGATTWRTLERRGVAIRIPAGMPGKLAAAQANPQRSSHLPKDLPGFCRCNHVLPLVCNPFPWGNTKRKQIHTCCKWGCLRKGSPLKMAS